MYVYINVAIKMGIAEDFYFIEPLKYPVLTGQKVKHFVEFARQNGLAEQQLSHYH
jgi:hypothetical protein